MAEPSSWRFNSSAYARFVKELPLSEDQVLLEYVYVGEDGESLASKCRRVDAVPESPDDIPTWTFAANFPVEDRFLKPVAIYKDPFRRGPHRLVLCEVFANDWTPAFRNFRRSCDDTMSTPEVTSVEPWFGLEQEYSIIGANNRPLGWPNCFLPQPTGPTHHDAVGMHKAFGRDLYEAHLFACMYAGVKISGGNAEACPGQWEFQVGPTIGVKAADDLWIARYLLHRLSEEMGVAVSFHPKPIPGDVGACGGHVNFSTQPMREDGGIEVIKSAMPGLAKTHQEYLPLCDPHGGADNQARLMGYFCTAPKEFTWGVEDRDAAVRIPREVEKSGKGFLEDRRPASNFDPYLVTDALVRVVVLGQRSLRNPYSEPRVPKLAVVPDKSKMSH
ncbi:glutamine synthetase 2 cytoplasmic [Aplysia californica]|uniref:glutamine synthetase n=1 Tax=Aplysia californica TaxID=6500 RepID=A0ABM1A6D8_APLCA|nr:glutamine synthetase 2 cytoplasmic [Aplysia californica]XP_012941688.1 glutamine synthetase 2 cytoplasmic [Aplysia californica]